MKKIIALVAVAAMLFAMVPAANAAAWTWPLNLAISDNEIIWGHDFSTDSTGAITGSHVTKDEFNSEIGSMMTNNGATSSSQSIMVTAKYGDLKKWYNYTNSRDQEAWFRLKVFVWDDSTLLQDGKSFEPAHPVYINGVAYMPARDTAGRYYIWYPVRAIKGGNTETLTFEYSPNGVESYVGTINFTYVDTSSNAAGISLVDDGSNAPYFNSLWSDSNMIFDTVTKSAADTMVRTNVEYKVKNAAGDVSKVKLPTIQMAAKAYVKDANGLPLPIRSTVIGSIAGVKAADVVANDSTSYGTSNFIYDVPSTGADNTGFLFNDTTVYSDTFSFSTKTDDQIYGELNSDGSFTVKVNIIDNDLPAIHNDLLVMMNSAIGSSENYITPYFTVLKDIRMDGNKLIVGAVNQVNYLYIDDVNQTFYSSSSALLSQGKSYDIKINSLDRITAPVITITGNSSDLLPPAAQRQLGVTNAHGAIVTDKVTKWTSSNPAVATVNSAGLVTALATGTTYITAHYEADSAWDTVAVNVGVPVTTPEITTPTDTTTAYYVTCRTLNVRKGPGTSYSRVGKLSRGTTVNVYEIDNGWARISYNGAEAYVSANYIDR